MKNIIKTLSLLSIIAVIPGAMAATSRVSMVSRASPRIPSIYSYIANNTANSSSATNGTATLWGDVDCINNYTDCITAEDVCGPNFEECTTNVLFHAQMPKCLNVLYQCGSNGIQSLFGTSDVTALAAIDSYKDDAKTEVDRYTYPLDGSVMGQRVIGGSIANKLNTEQCVRRYTNCLTREDVCGQDFELCTSPRDFKKQAVLCASTLARCENDGKKELFGSVANAENLKPEGENVRLKSMMEDGQQLAAINAVKTCQRITDNCLMSACLSNPWRCIEGTSSAKIDTADYIAGGTTDDTTSTTKLKHNSAGGYSKDGDAPTITTGSDVRKIFKAKCLETIGANQYCHMTYLERKPTNKDLMTLELQEEVFSLAYGARKELVNAKIQEELQSFDTKAKDACIDTITSCAMRSCGGGIGSVCYTQARTGSASSPTAIGAKKMPTLPGVVGSNASSGVQINGAPYNDIKAACEPIVNTDPNCMYAATDETDPYEHSYLKSGTFTKLFPDSSSTSDPIGAIAYLNSLLATSYNDAAIEDMKKQCRTVALSCVKSMCGKDYENCYRSRNDIVSGTYNTGTGLDKSMNKMGGVLDYNIVIGLCMNTVTTSSVCEEHLKIAISKDASLSSKATNTWGSSTTVNHAWGSANTTTATGGEYVVVSCRVGEKNASETCNEWDEMPAVDGKCVGIMDEDGCVYSEAVQQSYSEYTLSNGATTLFQELLRDVEKEVQAKYNAKLTKEKSMCDAQSGGGLNGGVRGANENGSTFMWAKLRSNKVPKNYSMKGLAPKEFVESNDLYGSFCRARVTITSDDKDIQNVLGDSAIAYFAVGDSFTCGSWIDDKVLAKISEKVGERKLCEEGYGTWDTKTGKCSGTSVKEKTAYAWATIGGLLGGGAIGTGLTESGLVGGLLNKANQKNTNKADQKQNKKSCIAYANEAITTYNADNTKNATIAQSLLKTANTKCLLVVAEDNTDECKIADENNIVASAGLIKAACEGAPDTKVDKNAAQAARIAVPIATSLAGAALGAGITASVINNKKENIKNEAVKEWMQEIGEHIQCYLGADELGSYGDVISFTID